MARDEEDVFGARPKPPVSHDIGQNLETLSVHELDERIGLLKAEIVRLEEARVSKEASKRAADAFFKS